MLGMIVFFVYFRVHLKFTPMTRIRFDDSRVIVCCIMVMFVVTSTSFAQKKGVGVKPPKGAEVFFDGSRKMLDEKWTYWEGPRLAAQLPIKWQIGRASCRVRMWM